MIVTQEHSEILRAIGRLEGRFDGLEKRIDGLAADVHRIGTEQRWLTVVMAALIGTFGLWG